MKYTSINYLPNIPVYPLPIYTVSSPLSSSPIPYNNVNDENNEERLIPFVGGALLGGLAGSTIGRQPYGYYPYPMYYNNYYPYYPNGNYYTYGGGYLPNTYNYYYTTPRTTK